MRYVSILFLCLVFAPGAFATTYYVSLTGNNANDGSSGRPWRTIQYAATKVPAGQGHTIQVSAGTFVENQIHIPAGVHLIGAGRDATIIKANPAFYYYPASPGFSNEKYLIRFYSGGVTAGNQSIKNFTIDGDGKKLHGGLFIHNRTNVTVDNIKVQYVNFNGIWVGASNNSVVKNIVLKDCAWGSSSWCSSALAFSNTTNLDISGFDIDEGRGYGIKNLGHDQNTPLTNVKVHHGKVSVHQAGLWNGGSAPNITIEFWASGFSGTEIYNTYVDNHISIVNPNNTGSATPLRIYNNFFDILSPRTNGAGYCIELSSGSVEIRNNWFNGGTYGIVNWASKVYSNWSIHHNVFYGLSGGVNPTSIVCSYRGGVQNLNVYNNTAELTSTSQAVHFVEFDNASAGTNVNIKNNLIVNSNGANKVVNLRNGAYINNLQVTNNFFQNIQQGTAPGNYTSNATGTAQIVRSGSKPHTFYNHVAGGNLIDKGVYVGFEGAPDIGACGDNNIVGTGGTSSTPPPTTNVAVTGVTVSPSSVTIGINATTTLTKTISPSNATNQSVSWSSSNTGIARVDAASGVVTGVAAGTATITVRTSDGGKTANATVTVTSSATGGGGGNGVLTRAVWLNISGDQLSALKSNGNFPNSPSFTNTVSSFAGPSNAGENYGTRIYGYIRPQTSGSYTFWIVSDDHSELYLSTDQNAANKTLIASVTGWANPGEFTRFPQQQSVVKNLVAGQYYYVEALHKEGTGGDHVAVYWQGPGISRSIIGSAFLSTTASSTTAVAAPAPVTTGGNGVLTRAVWTGISGDQLSTLKSNANFPNNPSSTTTVTSFAGPTNWADNYGSRIYGYVRPQTSGNYTFWITGDDQCELYLSTDQNQANKTLIASLPGWANPGELTRYSQQRSAVKYLTAGQYYYVEALHKEGTVIDHLSVYWEGPGIARAIIGSAYISSTAGSGGGGGSPEAAQNGLEEESQDEKFVVYPVPVKQGDDFTLELPAASKEVNLFDLNGKQHRNLAVDNETTVNVSSQGLDAGIYYFQVIHGRGSEYKKVMVR